MKWSSLFISEFYGFVATEPYLPHENIQLCNEFQ